MTFDPTTVRVALACGVDGAFVDVSDALAASESGLKRNWGKTSQFDAQRPGTWSFVLENGDGRFTPGNPSSALATPVREGMRAVWECDGRLVGGFVRAVDLVFPSLGAVETGRVLITVHDVLGELARTASSGGWRASCVEAASPVGYYPMDDAATGTGAADQSGRARGEYRFVPEFGDVTFGEVGEEHDRIRITGAGDAYLAGVGLNAVSSSRYFSLWLEPISTGGTLIIEVAAMTFSMTSGHFQLASAFPSTVQSIEPVVAGREYFIEIDSVGLTLTIDGVVQGTLAGTTATSTIGDPVTITWGDVTLTDLYLSDFALTDQPVRGDLLQAATRGGGAAEWLVLLENLSGFDFQIPSSLAPARIMLARSGASILDLLNDVLNAEQGAVYVETTGAFLAPSDSIVVYGRDRPTVVTASFSTTADIDGGPTLSTSSENALSQVTVRGVVQSTVVSDDNPIAATGSEAVALFDLGDLRAWGQDRLIRSLSAGVEVKSFTVDARLTDSDRWATLLALRPGQRIRVTGLPTQQLGFSSWDGWLLGVSEVHTATQNTFTLFLAPVLDAPDLFDVDRFMAGDGGLSLAAAVTASATAFSLTATGARVESSVDVNFVLQVDAEQVLVTACTTATPQVATVVRGVNGTTAAAHLAGAPLELAIHSDPTLLYPADDLFPASTLYPLAGYPSDWTQFAF